MRMRGQRQAAPGQGAQAFLLDATANAEQGLFVVHRVLER